MRWKSLVFIFFIFGIAACTATDKTIHRAIVLTQSAVATYTPTPDARIIEIGPEEFLLKEEDIPLDAEYYLENPTDIYRYSNSDILSKWDMELGAPYIQKTGRIDGWIVKYLIKDPKEGMPIIISHNVVQYGTVYGSLLSLNQNSPENIEWILIDDDYDLGTKSIVYEAKYHSDKSTVIMYKVETVYQNYKSTIIGFGIVDYLELKNILVVAQKAIGKLESETLINQ